MAISRRERPEFFRRVVFDHAPDAITRPVVCDDAICDDAIVATPVERARRLPSRPTESIVLRVPARART
jgi:hypothetical protein